MSSLDLENVAASAFEFVSTHGQLPCFRESAAMCTPIRDRNQQILELLAHAVPRRDIARRFQLSPARVEQIAGEAKARQAREERRAKLREEIRSSDNPERMWPVGDLAEAIGLSRTARNGLQDHFAKAGKQEMNLLELMDMFLSGPAKNGDSMPPPMLKVRGIGTKGFVSLAEKLANTDLGDRCNREWLDRCGKEKERGSRSERQNILPPIPAVKRDRIGSAHLRWNGPQ